MTGLRPGNICGPVPKPVGLVILSGSAPSARKVLSPRLNQPKAFSPCLEHESAQKTAICGQDSDSETLHSVTASSVTTCIAWAMEIGSPRMPLWMLISLLPGRIRGPKHILNTPYCVPYRNHELDMPFCVATLAKDGGKRPYIKTAPAINSS